MSQLYAAARCVSVAFAGGTCGKGSDVSRDMVEERSSASQDCLRKRVVSFHNLMIQYCQVTWQIIISSTSASQIFIAVF